MTTISTDKPPPTTDPRCATYAGYGSHHTRGETPCQPCKVAKRDYGRKRRATAEGREANRAGVEKFRSLATPASREATKARNREYYLTDAGRASQRAGAAAGRNKRRARTTRQADADFAATWPSGKKQCVSCGDFLSVKAYNRDGLRTDGRNRRCNTAVGNGCDSNNKILKRWAKLVPVWAARGIRDDRCIYLGVPIGLGDRDIEHFVPEALGGPSEPWNLLPASTLANRGIGGKSGANPWTWIAKVCPERIPYFRDLMADQPLAMYWLADTDIPQ